MSPERDEYLQRRDALWFAVLAACSINAQEVTAYSRPGYQKAVRALLAVGAVPGEVQRRVTWLRTQYTVPVTPEFLAKHWGERPPTPPRTRAGLFWHPDNCPTPCSGCAADKKAG